MKIEKVEQFLFENPKATANEIFGHYKLDLESILIAYIILDQYDPELKRQFDIVNSSEERITYLVNEYINNDKFSHTLIPHTLIAALYIFTKENHKNFADNIVNHLIQNSNYIKSIKDNNLFEKDLIILTSKLDLKKKNIFNDLKENFFNHLITFPDKAYHDFFYFLRLFEFSQFDNENIKEFENAISKIKLEDIYPSSISLEAKITDTLVLIKIGSKNIEDLTTSMISKKDLKKLVKNFYSNFFKDAFVDNGMEMLMKYFATSKIELTYVDIGVKVVKNLLITIAKQNSSILSKQLIYSNHDSFKMSGCKNMKEWYLLNLKSSIETLASEIKDVDFSSLSPSFYENHYQNFYVKYLSYYLDHPNSPKLNKKDNFSEDYVYQAVLDLVNNQSISSKKIEEIYKI